MTAIRAIGTAIIVMMLAIAPASAVVPAVQQQGNLSYVSGGVGADGRDVMDELSDKFNVHLIFAVKEGPYVADVRVRIFDQGGNELLDVIAEGPWFFGALPPGEYRIHATHGNQEKQQSIKISDRGKARMLFHF